MSARIALFLSLLISGCQAAPLAREECEERYVNWESTLAEQARVLEAGRLDGRRPAFAPESLDRVLRPEPGSDEGQRLFLTDETQDVWMSRAERGLKETQDWIEEVNGDPARRPATAELHQIANAWVTFHGYAYQKKTQGMQRMLTEIRDRMDKARTLVCGGTP